MICLFWVNIMIKCLGCGVVLQNQEANTLGYIQGELAQSKLCERCFKIQNYNQYQSVNKPNSEFIKMLEEINRSQDLVLLLIDVFNIPKDFDLINKYITNDIIVVLTKLDLLKPYLKEEKAKKLLNNLNYKELITISSYKNFNLDNLMNLLKNHKKSNNVYVIGYTNVGKSTLINKIIYNYSDSKTELTTSNRPTTTLDNIYIPINNKLTLVDTPGFIDENNIVDVIDSNLLKKIIPNKIIKPITFQVRKEQSILIDQVASVYIAEENDVTVYLSNKLSITRVFKKHHKSTMQQHVVRVGPNEDIVIKGLCFMKFKKSAVVELYTLKEVDVYVRPALI